ncbi:MAG TPA: 3-dehydro-L-gulonate 2-dehydrogenase [Chryseosolibacter sp.]|nr:3-dehydro-L-gulonate 2-dehydrogenase [Chryseosolibacter sp.]
MQNDDEIKTLRVPHETMRDVLYGILQKAHVPETKAKVCAEVFTSNSLEGVYSHGINRFSRFLSYIDKGIIKVDHDPVCINRSAGLEQWHGQSGIGITNALACTERAMELASVHGLGCVALANTNHWMRAGTYARHAAANGYAFLGWSNTIKNTPPWGAREPRLGNNPLAIGVPYDESPMVLDMAMSQFSYGALEAAAMNNDKLSVPGGFDEQGNLTTDPASILKSQRTLPIGYWKGSALSLILDILAATLSGGLSVFQISKQEYETNLSQVFVAFNLKALANSSTMHDTIRQVIMDLKQSALANPDARLRYPGESAISTRTANLTKGIPVNKDVWNKIISNC